MELKNKKVYTIKNKTLVKDEKEGGKYESFLPGYEIEANIYSGSGNLENHQYGQKVPTIKKMLFDGNFTVRNVDRVEKYFIHNEQHYMAVGDGVCVFAPADASPDYRIISINPAGHLKVILEKI